jgi:hypothetical protein
VTWTTPGGETWVIRSTRSATGSSIVDVFDAKGQLTSKLALPENTAIVGFGPRTLYLARSDADDLQYLQRITIG